MSMTRVSLQDSAASYAQVKTLAAVQRVVFGKTHGAIDVFVHIFYHGFELRGSRIFRSAKLSSKLCLAPLACSALR